MWKNSQTPNVSPNSTQLQDEVRGGARRSLPARGSNPNPRCCRSQPRGEDAIRRLLGAPSTVLLLRGARSLGSSEQPSREWRGGATASRNLVGRQRRGLAAARRRSGPHGPSRWWSGAHALGAGALAAWAVRLGGRRACEELGAWEDVGCGWGVVVLSGSRRVESVAHLSAQIGVTQARLA